MTRSILPTWLQANDRVSAGTATPLDRFIDDNEPADREGAAEFRAGLIALLNHENGSADPRTHVEDASYAHVQAVLHDPAIGVQS